MFRSLLRRFGDLSQKLSGISNLDAFVLAESPQVLVAGHEIFGLGGQCCFEELVIVGVSTHPHWYCWEDPSRSPEHTDEAVGVNVADSPCLEHVCPRKYFD